MLKFQVYTSGLDYLPVTLNSAAKQAETAIANEIMKDTVPFVPMLTGRLSNDTRVDGNKIIYPPPYARYLYYGKVMEGHAPKRVTEKPLSFTTDYHRNAQAFWFEASKAQNMKKWERVAEKAVKRYIKSK